METLSKADPRGFGRFMKKNVDALVAAKLSSLGFMSYDTFSAQRNFLDSIEKRVCLLEEKLDLVERSISEEDNEQHGGG